MLTSKTTQLHVFQIPTKPPIPLSLNTTLTKQPFSLNPQTYFPQNLSLTDQKPPSSLPTPENLLIEQDKLSMPGILMKSFGPSMAPTLTKKRAICFPKSQNQQFFRQQAAPKVKIISSAARDLKISHRLLH